MLAYSSEREKNRYKINRNISSIQYNSLNLTQSKIGGTSEMLKKIWHFIRFALSLPSMIQFGDNTYIYNTHRATGEKLTTQFAIQAQPILSPLSGNGGALETESAAEPESAVGSLASGPSSHSCSLSPC